MEGYIMDTSAWIEFFRGSPEGKKVAEYLFPELTEIAPSVTPTLVITEMQSVYIRNGEGDKFSEDVEKIQRLSEIEERINQKIAINAGMKHGNIHNKENRISYVDCILWTLAEERNMKVISTDEHFRKCENAVYIEKGGYHDI
ncbi:MAG: PIN domain-containing protein [Candidatus Methanofastidiosia archaeon]